MDAGKMLLHGICQLMILVKILYRVKAVLNSLHVKQGMQKNMLQCPSAHGCFGIVQYRKECT